MLSKFLLCQLIIILPLIGSFVLDNKEGHFIVIAQETPFPESRFNSTSPLPEINEDQIDTAIPELGLGPLPTPFVEPEEIQPLPEGTPTGEQIIRVRTICDLLGSDNTEPLFIAVDTDKVTYTPGQIAKIFLFITDDKGCFLSAPVRVEMLRLNSDKVPVETVYSQSFVSNGTYNRNFGIGLEQQGEYKVTASILTHNDDITNQSRANQTNSSWTMIEVKNWIETRPASMLLVAVVSFAGLMTTIALIRESSVMSEILRFIFISGIIFAIILSFTFMNEEIGAYAPIGLVKKPPSPASGEWVVNIGGNQRDGYQDGIQIPIVVVVFGIVGGYLRYLYKTANLHKDKHKKEENEKIDKDVTRLDLFYQSLEDIALMFLAPLLAIAVYFLLSIVGLEGPNAVYSLAVISFSIGLVTDEVINALIRFTREKLGLGGKDSSNKKNQETKTK